MSKKKNYTVEITVTIGGTHTVSASSVEEAKELALLEWDEANGEVVERFATPKAVAIESLPWWLEDEQETNYKKEEEI